ncbi:PREDICTED: uncharacterized protein LOC106809104, partial [Priapulus caudatus]|uniref:Uncharacterized protein LOC106809104 n=1 Tax=Priapulus caudatus TaxID=37621 RepID=A0ABM1E5S8_PRICU
CHVTSTCRYFSQKQLLDRVPSFFLVFGGIYAVIQLIGCCLLFSAPPTVALNEEKEDEEKKPLVENGEQKKPLVAEASSVGIDVPPLAVLRTRSFWTLWIIIATGDQGIFFVANLYKVYGQTFIYDDKFLALVGSLASIGNSLGRIMWGIVIDKSTFKTCMICLNAGLFALVMTLIATPHGGATMYAVWISAIYLVFSGLFILIPTAVSRCFGQKYFAINFGLVFSANAITTPIGALLASLLLDPLGWFGMFSLVSACVLAAMAFTFTFNGKRADGRPV